MKSMFSKTVFTMAAFLMGAALAGCATAKPEGSGQASQASQPPSQEEHQSHHPDGASPQPAEKLGPRSSGSQSSGMSRSGGGLMGMMGSMDMKSMCDMHNKMMQGKTSEQQAGMMNEHMKSMSPDQQQKHMEMMQQQCR